MSLDLESERFARLGNLSARGFGNQLGRPDLDVLSVLVREAVQNSWDARRPENGVRFMIDLWELKPTQRRQFANLFRDRPREDSGLGALIASRSNITMLALSDRGTVGLNGPTGADEVDEGESSNFVDFLRNAGREPDREGTGGTYGYGKAAFFAASAVRMVIAHTRFVSRPGTQSRLMATAWGPEHSSNGGRASARYTGRHWWGRADRSGGVQPVTGNAAEDIARELGLPEFVRDETGTGVVVVQPALGDAPISTILDQLERSILTFFWPRMIGEERSERIEFSVSCNGEQREIPRPESYPPLAGYVAAMRQLEACRVTGSYDEQGIYEISSQRPKRLLGHVAVRRFEALDRVGRVVDGSDEALVPDAPTGKPCHHVALLRHPRLVVAYRPGPPLATDLIEYGGVFLAAEDAEVERAFSDSEPPTHDAWVARGLTHTGHKRIVSVALRRIDESLRNFVGVGATPLPTGGGLALGPLAYALRGLVPGLEGSGPEEPGPTGPPPGGPRPGPSPTRVARASILAVQYEMVSAIPAVLIRFSLSRPPRGYETRIAAIASVRVDDGGSAEAAAPAGASKPTVLYWETPAGRIVRGVDHVVASDREDGNWVLAVALPGDALLSVALELEAVQ